MDEVNIYKRILVPLDGSELGAAAIPYAETLGQALDAELVLFHVVQPVTMVGTAEVGVPYTQPVADENRRTSTMAYLDGVRKTLNKKRLKVSSEVALGSPPD